MKTRYTVALSLLAGAVLGATAMQGLHAQAKPPAFVIAEIDVTNQDGFVKEFAPLAVKALGENGPGYKAIARGGKTVAIEGAPPKTRIVINHFDSLDAAMAAYNSAAYKKAREVGNKYGTFRIYATEGVAQ
jgi:uncharacterized protein (DUF1330 family)